jgi:sirohydrochlorin cobaltochelatase
MDEGVLPGMREVRSLVLELIPYRQLIERINPIMKRPISRLLASLAFFGLVTVAGCASTPPAATTAETPSAGASLAPTAAAKKALLVVSFGTSYDDNRELSIGGVEQAIAVALPDFEIRRAFTAQTVIDILAERGTHVDNVKQAMDRLVADGVTDVVIQPTTLMAGYEYMDLVTETSPYQAQFSSFAIGSPLLTTDDDFKAVAKAITSRTAQHAGDGTAVIFMGHGTTAPSVSYYGKLGGVLADEGHKNYFVGALEGSPSLADMIKAAKDAKVSNVVLQPLMVVAGDHTNNDMAGDEADSWKSQFTKAGFQVETLIEGLGQNPEIQRIYVEHARAAVDETAADPRTADPSAPAPQTSPDPAEELAVHDIKAGSYPINAATESSMFKIVEAELEVEEEHMLVTVTLSGDGYGRLILGTAANATKASTGFIEFETDAEGRHVYVVPVSRLNKPMSIAAESMKTPGTFYDQTVVFRSDKLPADALTG